MQVCIEMLFCVKTFQVNLMIVAGLLHVVRCCDPQVYSSVAYTSKAYLLSRCTFLFCTFNPQRTLATSTESEEE
jgi:hypothetical protein